MNSIVFKQTVRVGEYYYEITVHQESKTVWIARGECMGEQIETEGPRKDAAVINWREAACRGNSV